MANKYAFLLPAYKSVFLEESLRSIVGQSYMDFTVLVSDDCSPHNIKAIVDKVGDSRVIYRRNDSNIGAEHLVDHWNMLLDMTDAEYIVMASDDDVYDARFLEEIDKLTVKYPDVDVLQARITRINSCGEEFWRETLFESDLIDRKTLVELYQSNGFSSGIPQYVFRRERLIGKRGFVKFPLAWFSDDASVAMMSGNGLAIVQKHLVRIRFSGISISSSPEVDDLYWQQKISASSEYFRYMSQMLSGYNDESMLAIVQNRARRGVYPSLKAQNMRGFLRWMSYLRSLKSPLYPFSWRMKRYAGRIYHRVARI